MSQKPNPSEDQIADAVRLIRAQRYEDAARVCRAVLAGSPHHVGALLALAETHELQDRLPEATALTDQALRLAPQSVFGWNKRGTLLGKAKRFDEALAAFKQGHTLAPNNCDVLRNIAKTSFLLQRYDEALVACEALAKLGDEQGFTFRADVYRALGRPHDALDSLVAALDVSPNNARLNAAIGAAQFALARFEEAEFFFRKAAALDPARGVYLSDLGLTLSELGRNDEALDVYDKALTRTQDDSTARWNRSLSLLVVGRFVEGFADHEARLSIPSPNFERVRPGGAPALQRGDDIAGKTVLLYCGQGLGDTIQFFRYAPGVAQRGARVVVEAQPSLCALLRESAPGITVTAQGEQPPTFDLHLPVVSIPFRFGLESEQLGGAVPYLTADSTKRARWRARLDTMGRGRKVGVAWAGNPEHVRDKHRSIPLSMLASLFARKDIGFVSLQKTGLKAEDVALLERHNVLDVSKELRDFSDTAALVSELDLVITIDSAVAHLSGALGQPVWVLLPFAPDWRWLLKRSDSPWYPTALLFRQPERGDWKSVITDVGAALAQG